MSRSTDRRAAAALFLVLYAAQSGFVALTPIVPDVAAAYDTSTAAVGALRLAAALAGGVVALGAWRLLATVPPHVLLIRGLLVIASGSIGSALAPTFELLVAAQLAVGAGVAACIAGSVAAVSQWASPDGRPGVLAWSLAGPPVAWIVGMPAIGAMGALGWRVAWAALPTGAALLALAALAVRRRTGTADGPVGGAEPPVLRDRLVAGYAVAETLAYAAWGGTLLYAGALLRDRYDASLATTGLLLGAGAVAYLPGTLLAARLARARGHGRTLRTSTLSAAALVVLFGVLRPSLAASTVLFATLAFVAAVRMFAGGAQAVHAEPRRQAAMAGARAAATQFGYVLGAAVGVVVLPLGGYAALGGVLGIMFVAAAGVSRGAAARP